MGWIDDNFSLITKQRTSIILLLGLLSIFLIVLVIYKSAFVPEQQFESPTHARDVADRIDINSADWSTLAVLPSIGEKRAKDIIEVREQLRAANPDRPPFESVDDLDKKVKGIGPATIA